ncbi:MAG: GspH/FimT family pseudopilin [Pseudomonadota bacterium]
MHSKSTGFTLIELLFSISVLALLLSLAAPTMQEFQQRQRIVSLANELVGHINIARMHAISAHELTILCPSSNGLACSDSNRWELGWMVFRDPDRNGMPDQADHILRVGAGTRSLIVDSGGRTRLRYQADGTAGGSNQTIKLCDPNYPDQSRAVIISNPGRPRVDALPEHLSCPEN